MTRAEKMQEIEAEYNAVMSHLVSDENIDFWFMLACEWAAQMRRVEQSEYWL